MISSLSPGRFGLLLLLGSILFISPFDNIAQEENAENIIIYATESSMEAFSYYGDANSISEFIWLNAAKGSLYRYEIADGVINYVPELADGIPIISNDGLTYTIKLKDNLLFASGNPITADDVQFTWQTHLTPAISSTWYEDFSTNLFASNSSIKKIDDLTISFTFMEAKLLNFENFVKVDIIELNDRLNLYQSCLAGVTVSCNWEDNSTGAFAPTSGPFIMDYISSDKSEVHLVKNENYYNAKNMKIDKFIIKWIPDRIKARNLLISGEVDILGISYFFRPSNFSSNANVRQFISQAPIFQELSLNHLHPIYGTGVDIPDGTGMSNNDAVQALMVRKAMSHLINRELIANEIYDGLAQPASVSLSPSAPGFKVNLKEPRNYSISVARNYMEMAGFDFANLVDGNNDGDYNDEGDIPFFTVNLLTTSWLPERVQYGQMFADELPKIGVGINYTVFGENWPEFFLRSFNWQNQSLIPLHEDGGYDMLFIGYINTYLSYAPPVRFSSEYLYDSNFPRNVYNYIDPEITQLVSDYFDSKDIAETLPIVTQLQKAIYENIPTIPIIYPIGYFFSGARIEEINSLLLTQTHQYWPDVFNSEWAGESNSDSPVNYNDDLIRIRVGIGVLVIVIIVSYVIMKKR